MPLGGHGGSQVLLVAGEADATASIHIEAPELPEGAVFSATDGNPSLATLAWPTIRGSQVLTFTAVDDASGASTSLTIVVRALPTPASNAPTRLSLVGPGDVTRSAFVMRRTAARAEPGARAHVVALLSPFTVDATPNLVELVEGERIGAEMWVRVKLAVLPNGSTGWVPRSALGPFRLIRTRLVVDRRALTATLFRLGRAIFRAPVGVGALRSPTPAGSFFVREKLTGFDDPFYGPLAFGTNARSAVLTDWPGGGFIGIHGTDAPALLPGRVSHGCIRMRNDDILRLASVMPLGTPVLIR